jgi:hypothetical protein
VKFDRFTEVMDVSDDEIRLGQLSDLGQRHPLHRLAHGSDRGRANQVPITTVIRVRTCAV